MRGKIVENTNTDTQAQEITKSVFVMKKALREMVEEGLKCEYRDGLSWAAVIVRTLMQIAVTPDEYTEDAAVNAARLIWEILNDGEVHRKDD